jgi:S1-C subfamily serine protease
MPRQFVALGVLSLCIAAPQVVLSDEPARPLTISVLKSLEYSPAAPDALPRDVHYRDIRDKFQLFATHSYTALLLKEYREPILTRGARGVTLFRTTAPAVVLVAVGSLKQGQFQLEGTGTGAIIDSRGYVLTNWHVIAGYRGAIVFLKPPAGTDPTQSPSFGATVLAQDPVADLALLKLLDPPATLPVIRFGDINQAQVADDIHIVGHPEGLFWSYSTGVISQIRDGHTWRYEDGSSHRAKVIQMQTAINPGNSGGPVLNDAGLMVGLVAMSKDGQNLNFAIAGDELQRFISRNLPARMRGTKAATKAQEGPEALPTPTLSTARTNTGQLIVKAEYPEITVYAVTADTGGIKSILAVSGAYQLHASDWRGGYFHAWRSTMPDGTEFKGIVTEGQLSAITHAR